MPLRLRADIATTGTDDGLVLLDERTGRYWQLNPTGTNLLTIPPPPIVFPDQGV